MDQTRMSRRVRQACEPCRRKKSKCPGERPECSYCQRLAQPCYYETPEQPDIDNGRHQRKLEYRMGHLEGKLDQLLEHLRDSRTGTPAFPRESTVLRHPTPPSTYITPRNGDRSEDATYIDSRDEGFEDETILQAGQLYLTWCHNQPIALFPEENFLESLKFRSHELLLALQALSLRFPPGARSIEHHQELSNKATEARRIVMTSLADDSIELSTLQTLCLLSLIEFTDGKTARADMSLNIASGIIQRLENKPASTRNNPQQLQEIEYCLRTICFLRNLHVCAISAPRASSCAPYHCDNGNFSEVDQLSIEPWIVSPLGADISPPDADGPITTYSSLLSQVWHMAQLYAANRTGRDTPPPWQAKSDYTIVMQRYSEVDCLLPLKFRLASNRFDHFRVEDLHDQRTYWSPWLFIMFMYSAVPCILNHPLLLSLRLRNFRNVMPQTFIQQSFEMVNRYSAWIMHFLDLIEKKGFQVSDPTLGYCVLIVATIHLQHSFVQDDSLKRKSQAGFDKCLKFLQTLGKTWPSVMNMANNLVQLQESIKVVQTTTRQYSEQVSWSIDSELLRKLLILETAGRRDATVDQTILGPSFMSRVSFPVPRSEEASSELNLIGSAGISGHRTVDSRASIYPPEDADESSASFAGGQVPGDWGFDNTQGQFSEDIGEIGGDQENIFSRPNDFGWAIENYLDLNLR